VAENNPKIKKIENHEWEDDGHDGIKPVIVEYEVKEKSDAPDTLTPTGKKRDWNPETDFESPS